MPTYPLSGLTAITAAQIWDTATPPLQGSAPNQYYFADSFARAVVLLPAGVDSLTVEAVAKASGVFDQITIWVNGVYNQSLTFTSLNTKQQITATLPAGAKTVELVCDAFITAVSATAYDILPAPTTVASRLVEWGDSIGRGYSYSPLTLSHLPKGVRNSGKWAGVTDVCNAGDALYYYRNGIPALVSLILSRFADCPSGTRVLFLEMLTNDYGLDLWSATAWAPVYASLLDGLHASDPTLQIVCNKGFARSATGAQGTNGSTFAAFQAGVVAAVAARSSYCRVLDVPDLTTADLVDGLHPNNAGHDKIAAALVALFPVAASTSLIVLPGGSKYRRLRG